MSDDGQPSLGNSLSRLLKAIGVAVLLYWAGALLAAIPAGLLGLLDFDEGRSGLNYTLWTFALVVWFAVATAIGGRRQNVSGCGMWAAMVIGTIFAFVLTFLALFVALSLWRSRP